MNEKIANAVKAEWNDLTKTATFQFSGRYSETIELADFQQFTQVRFLLTKFSALGFAKAYKTMAIEANETSYILHADIAGHSDT